MDILRALLFLILGAGAGKGYLKASAALPLEFSSVFFAAMLVWCIAGCVGHSARAWWRFNYGQK